MGVKSIIFTVPPKFKSKGFYRMYTKEVGILGAISELCFQAMKDGHGVKRQ